MNRMYLVWISGILLSLLISCNPEEILPSEDEKVFTGEDVFVMYEGQHYAFNRKKFLKNRKPLYLRGELLLPKSNWYPRPNDSPDWDDVNKIFGIGQGEDFSWRLGYRNDWNRPGWGQLYLYYHSPVELVSSEEGFYNPQRKLGFFPLCSIEYGNRYHFSIDLEKGSVGIWEVDEQGFTHGALAMRPFALRLKEGEGNNRFYLMSPYHGGNNPAPHTLFFKVSWEVKAT